MATSGTSSFTLTVEDLLAEAFDRIGGEVTTGYELRSAKRTLGLFLLDMSNRGLQSWAVERSALPLAAGQATYALPADTVDWLDAMLSRDGTDLRLERLGVAEYESLPTKATTGRPTRFMVERGREAPSVTFWPVPDLDTDVVRYRRKRRLEDAGSMVDELDVPTRFLPAVVSGLAWSLADKRPTVVDPARRSELLARFHEEMARAQDEDSERVSLFIRPTRRRR